MKIDLKIILMCAQPRNRSFWGFLPEILLKMSLNVRKLQKNAGLRLQIILWKGNLLMP